MTKRKTPVKHIVKAHKREGATVYSYNRGSGQNRSKHIAIPMIKISAGSDLYEAKEDTYGGYWTVIFKPDGHYLGRYSKSEAIKKAFEGNHNFLTTSPYVGLEISTYNSGGQLTRKNKIIATYENNPDLVTGTVQALLDNGSKVTMNRAYFDKKLSEQQSAMS